MARPQVSLTFQYPPHQGSDWWTSKGVAQVRHQEQPHEV